MHRPWLERYESTLGGCKCTRRDRAWLVAEMRDHLLDLRQEGLSMEVIEARLGRPESLAISSAQVIRRSFLRRHPVITCLTGPLAATLTIAALYVLVLFGAAWAVGVFDGDEHTSATLSPLSKWSIETAVTGLSFVPFALAAACCAYLARRGAVTARWAICGSGLIAILAGMFTTGFRFADTPGTGYFSVGLAFGTDLQWLQLAVPCVVLALMLLYPRRKPEPCEA